MRTYTLRASTLLAVVVAAFLIAAPAFASCAPAEPIPDAIGRAPVVFVGTVTAVDELGRIATVQVNDVWKGEVGHTAVVHGGPEVEPGVATSVDRTYEVGTTYLFVPYGVEAGAFVDNACSATQPFGDHLTGFRPEPLEVGPVTIQGDPIEAAGRAWWPVLVGSAIGIGTLAMVAVLVARRTRRLAPPQKATPAKVH